MRKNSKEVARAFLAGERKSIGSKMTDGQALYYHGHIIARKRPDINATAFETSLAGYGTVTTRETLNTLLHLAGSPYGYCQHKGTQCLYDWATSRRVVIQSLTDFHTPSNMKA